MTLIGAENNIKSKDCFKLSFGFKVNLKVVSAILGNNERICKSRFKIIID